MMRISPARASALGLAAAVACCGAPSALADGDPASDTLYVRDVFYPYSPAVTVTLQHRLDHLAKRSHEKGYVLKIALIQSPGDLGAYASLFNHPRQYAKLLYSELRYGDNRPHLLVVMPAGFGAQAVGKEWRATLGGVRIDKSDESNGLATAAVHAVRRLRPSL